MDLWVREVFNAHIRDEAIRIDLALNSAATAAYLIGSIFDRIHFPIQSFIDALAAQ